MGKFEKGDKVQVRQDSSYAIRELRGKTGTILSVDIDSTGRDKVSGTYIVLIDEVSAIRAVSINQRHLILSTTSHQDD